ncbi:hypothetical protein BJY00DRAFT_315600 [Aspergillus carlsbadensis]|nr:hypothetical protein BJY00DRAFT_315600 [Aspergillus carlsbadensis]
MRPSTRDGFEVAIVCALTLEADAVEELFDEIYDRLGQRYGKQSGDNNAYINGKIGRHDVVLCYLPGMGKGSAAAAAANLRVSYRQIRLALLVGICGGVPFLRDKTEILLGDVIISSSVIEYDFGRQYPDGFRPKSDVTETLGRPNLEIRAFLAALGGRGTRNELQERTRQHLAILQTRPDKGWQHPGTLNDVLFEPNFRHKHYSERSDARCLCDDCHSSGDPVCEAALQGDCKSLGCTGATINRTRHAAGSTDPAIFIGRIASADMVMKSGQHRDKISKQNNVIAFEMEGAGIWDSLPCIIIKGVCDYADSHKNKIWQGYAAGAAACCSKAFLEYWLPSSSSCEFLEGWHCMITFTADLPTAPDSSSLSTIARYLREYYTTPPRLMVQRISGEPLPMHQCYINLALIEQQGSAGRKSGENVSPSSLFSRLKVDTVKAGDQIALADLFDSRTSNDGTRISPRRIFIQGRAGVGKTTLCKKIVHDFLYQGMWQKHFDMLLWIPFRSLRGIPRENATLDALLHRVFFPNVSEGRDLGNKLQAMVSDPRYRPKILLMLDGLDEVSQEWNTESSAYNLLLRLLNHPQVIITSRPYGMHLAHGSFDLELEAVGFDTEQVEAYIQKLTSHDPQKAASIISFIHDHEIIDGLVRIPIQLDAVCYSWDRSFMADKETKTMTSLYETLALKLWQKDVLRLTHPNTRMQLNEDAIRSLSFLQTHELIHHEIDFVEILAFTGMYNEIIEFSSEKRHRIYELLSNQGVTVPDMPETVLQKISFLHSSDPTLIDSDRSYHFLHLTFQEFFAARYFVRCWNRLEGLLCLKLSQGVPAISRISPQNFLGANKYDSRCDIMWRFVAGLLSRFPGSMGATRPLDNFFIQIEAQPRDILGPAHQRLLFHCLGEVPANQNGTWDRAVVEATVYRWTRWTCELNCLSSFTSEREFPGHIMDHLLQDEIEDDWEMGIFIGFLSRPTPFPSFIKYLYSRYGNNTDAELPALDALGPEGLTLAAFEAIVPRLKRYKRLEHRFLPLRAWLARFLPQLWQRLLPYLDHESDAVRSTVTDAFDPSLLPPAGIEALLRLIQPICDPPSLAAVKILGKQEPLSAVVIDALLLLLNSGHLHIRQEAAESLARQSHLTPTITEALLCALEDGLPFRCDFVVSGLILSDHLEPSTLRRCLKMDITVAKKTLDCMFFHNQSCYAPEILEVLLEFLDHDDEHVTLRIVWVLAMQKSLPTEVISSLVHLLNDENDKTAVLAAIACYRQPHLSQSCIATPCNNHSAVVQCVARILGRQSPVSEGDFRPIQHLLELDIYSVPQAIADALAEQSPVNWDAVRWLLQYDRSKQAVCRLIESDVRIPVQAINCVLRFATSGYYLAALLCLRATDSIQQLERIRAFIVDHALYDDHGLMGILRQKPSLPEVMFQDFLGILQDETCTGLARALADRLLQLHGRLHQDLPANSWRHLYRIWQDRSWREQLSCCLIGNSLVLVTPEGVTKIVFGKKQLRVFKHAVRTEQLNRGVPADTLLPESRRDRVRVRLTRGLF